MTNFSEFNLLPALADAIAEEGYERPTPIQQQAIPVALAGEDVLGCAQTGTGKTAAFALPILHRLAEGEFSAVAKRPLALVIAPTRELAIQIEDSFKTYGRHTDVKHAVVYGGVGQGRQVQAIEEGIHVLIATPGRLLDLMGQRLVFLNRLLFFVVDEADRLMDMGFLPDLKKVIRDLPMRRQSMFFSATMPPKVMTLAESMLFSPTRIEVAPQDVDVSLIDQRVIRASHAQKKPLLVKLIKAGDVGQAIVFTRTKRGANSVAEYLRKQGIDAQPIHGNLTQNARKRVLDSFRADKVHILVATDLASRGIDVDRLSHVFNFELPSEPDSYIHRIGRTGRAGAQGVAISLCSPDESDFLQEIERHIGFEILPDGREPDPLPKSVVTESATSDTAGKKNRRQRRRRSRGNRDSEATNETSSDSSTEKRRPTAAERKAARNRRRRKTNKENDE